MEGKRDKERKGRKIDREGGEKGRRSCSSGVLLLSPFGCLRFNTTETSGPWRAAERKKTKRADIGVRSRLHRELNGEAARLAASRESVRVRTTKRTHDSVRSLRFEVWPSLCRLPP